MMLRLLIILLLPTLVAAEDIEVPDRDIIAAYPLSQPIDTIGEIHAYKITRTRTTLIHPEHEHFTIDLLPEHLKRIPRYELTWMIYDKTAHRLIVRASARYHYLLGALIKREYKTDILRQDCAVYEVPTEQAMILTAAPFPDLTQLPPPVLTASAQIRNYIYNVVEKRGSNGSLHIEWDSQYSERHMALTSMVNLSVNRFGRLRNVKVDLIHEPLAPIVIALGPAVTRPDHTLIATISATPVSAYNEPLIEGRICEEPSDFLIFAFGRLGKPLSTVDPRGVEVIGYHVPPDFLSSDPDKTPVKPTMIKAVRGTSLENVPLIDASTYLKSRGIRFNDDDWAVFEPAQAKLHVRLTDKESLKSTELLVGYYGSRHGYSGNMMRCELTTQSRSPDKKPVLRKHHHFCSIPSTFGAPSRLTISENDEEIASIDFDPRINFQGIVDLSLHSHFPITADGNSTFRIDDARFTLTPDKPFLIDTGLDSKDGSSLWLAIGARNFHADLPTPK